MDESKLEQLRSLIQCTRPAARKSHPFSLLSEGIPKNAVSELIGASGQGKTEVLLRFINENPNLKIAWVEEEMNLYPIAFAQAGIDLRRLLFVEAGTNALWSAHQILRSKIFDFVVLGPQTKEISEVELRRLQLSAERFQTSVLMLSKSSSNQNSWPIVLQAQIHRAGPQAQPQIDVLKSPIKNRMHSQTNRSNPWTKKASSF